MQTEIQTPVQQDGQAVTAVRQGDTERYRELVERHERRVFAVAWSRLGDVTLAEEATQEAFIRGYRRLWLLSDGSKFSGWIASIARNAAINLGLRHRRELDKRERWALEQTDSHPSSEEAPEVCAPETLRQTLAELTDAHRECLVLFYLEGKSGAEAATALGVSEAAFRVRLHRARAALREQLEEKLAGSLEQLRPTKALLPAIMAGVLASSSAKAAAAGGVGATILGTLTKLAPLKWAFIFFPFLFALPMVLFSWLQVRSELANFRDVKGFRVRMFREQVLHRLILMLVIVAAVFCLLPLGKIGLENLGLIIITAFSGLAWLMTWRQHIVNHSRYFVVTFLSSGFLLTGFLLMGFHVLPFSFFYLFVGAQLLMTTLISGERPARMDYNLFLRAAEGMLGLAVPMAFADARQPRFGKRELLAFARFLGSRWLADSYRWTAEGLLLRLPAFKFSLWNAMGFFSSWSHRSQLLLKWDGKVSAQLCPFEKRSLLDLHPHDAPGLHELESRVAVAVETGWNHFDKDNFVLAERVLGQVPEAEVFLKSPAHTGFVNWRARLVTVLFALMIIFTGLNFFKPPWMAWMDRLKPVSVTEAEVRAFLDSITVNTNPIVNHTRRTFPNDPGTALLNCMVLPSTNLFSPESLRAMRDTVAGGRRFESMIQSSQWRSFDLQLLPYAMDCGWISWNDLEIGPAELAAFLRTNQFQWFPRDQREFFLARGQSWSWVKQERFDVMRIMSFGLNQLRLLRTLNRLDSTDGEKLIAQIASVQTLSGTPPGQPPIHDWRDVRGLFFTPGWPALQDTYFSLAALEILGGLDKIDREACIRGILKRHSGKGYFTSPNSGGYNEYHIDGSARDTIAAFESLRILGALDRVKDLDQWQFRVKSNRSSKPDALGVRTLTWDEVEAWVCQQRLERILRERRENPQIPVRSLREA